MALRDGGLPSVSDALGVKVKNGGEAVKVFVEGVKTMVQEESKESKETKEAKETKETKDEKRDSMDPDL
ncbi:MAG: hypothetical protein M1826_005401 [Phylliscum demangeonii]|nr:MAG: hypothetical protein M1826_005401 [Phylliscum demangeonii]